MKTVAIETNVLIGFRLQREPGFKTTKNLFESCLAGKSKIFLPVPALLETEWVLRSYYKQPKEQVITFFQELLAIDNIIMDHKNEDIKIALSLYKTSSGVSFTDCLILAQILRLEPDEFLTLDEKLEKFYQTKLSS